MYYADPVYRPPSEFSSLLIQATVGCSAAAAGRCHFCNSNVFNQTVPQKKFRIRPTDEILEDIDKGRRTYGVQVEKIFLLDSSAMIIKSSELLKIVQKCYKVFPQLKQVACYACSEDILRKDLQELTALREAGLNLVFVGLESGDQQVLELVNKGTTVRDQINAVVKANRAGMRTSVSVILGLGGKKLSEQHAINTGKIVTAMNPSYLAALTLMVVPGTELDKMVRERRFELVADPLDVLKELHLMIMHIEASGPVVFRVNHASNYLSLRGNLPDNKAQMLCSIRGAMQDPTMLRSESLRGL
jgi:radical SAM superfamily enzyme YgiQ (UPF0313 family)